MADSLDKNGIEYCFVTDADGRRHEEKWRNEMKGLDDYLLSNRS